MGGNAHPKMDRASRAKQFMPFAAVKGLKEALMEKDYKLRRIQRMDIVTAEYYHRGEYLQITGVVSGIDKTGRVLKIVNTSIPFEDISDLRE